LIPVGVDKPISLAAVHPFFVPDESITWSVTYAGIEGGLARFAVGTPGTVDGKHVVVARVEAESAGLVDLIKHARDGATSWIDVDTGVPVRVDSDSDIDGKDLIVRATRRGEALITDLLFSTNAGPEQKRAQKLPDALTTDPLGALMLLRGWDAPAGSRAVLFTLGGLRLWRTTITVGKVERVSSPMGKRRAVRLDGVSQKLTMTFADDKVKPRTFTMWITDDPDRLPIQIVAHTEYGDVKVQATSYEAGAAD
jgi:hypothetical protein